MPAITRKSNEQSGLVIIKNGMSIFGHLIVSQTFDGLFETRKVEGSDIVKCIQKKFFC